MDVCQQGPSDEAAQISLPAGVTGLSSLSLLFPWSGHTLPGHQFVGEEAACWLPAV